MSNPWSIPLQYLITIQRYEKFPSPDILIYELTYVWKFNSLSYIVLARPNYPRTKTYPDWENIDSSIGDTSKKMMSNTLDPMRKQQEWVRKL